MKQQQQQKEEKERKKQKLTLNSRVDSASLEHPVDDGHGTRAISVTFEEGVGARHQHRRQLSDSHLGRFHWQRDKDKVILE